MLISVIAYQVSFHFDCKVQQTWNELHNFILPNAIQHNMNLHKLIIWHAVSEVKLYACITELKPTWIKDDDDDDDGRNGDKFLENNDVCDTEVDNCDTYEVTRPKSDSEGFFAHMT